MGEAQSSRFISSWEGEEARHARERKELVREVSEVKGMTCGREGIEAYEDTSGGALEANTSI